MPKRPERTQKPPAPVPDGLTDWLPAWGGIILAIVARVLYALPIVWCVWVGFGAVAIGAMTVDLLPRRAARAVGTLTVSVQWAAWSALGYHVWPTAGLYLIGAAVLIWTCSVIGWGRLANRHPRARYVYRKIRRKRQLAAVRDNFVAFASACRWPDDMTYIDTKQTRSGADMVAATPGDAAALEGTTGNVASVLHVGSDQVKVYPDPDHNGIVHVRLTMFDPLEKAPPWNPPEHGQTITAPVPLAVDDAGETVRFPIVGSNLLVAGRTRWGKTHALHMMSAHVSACDDAELWIIETEKQGADFGMWRGVAARFVDNPADTARTLSDLRQIAQDRYNARNATGRTGRWDPTTEGPQIVVILDEVSLDDKQATATLQWLAKRALGAGISLVIGVQSPQHTVFDIETRRQIAGRLILGVESGQASDLGLWPGAAAQGFDASKLPDVGYAFAYHPEWGKRPRRCRTFHARDAQLREYAKTARARCAHSARTPDDQGVPDEPMRARADAHTPAQTWAPPVVRTPADVLAGVDVYGRGVLVTLAHLGGSGRVRHVGQAWAGDGSGPHHQTIRKAFAALEGLGAVSRDELGVWALTELGWGSVAALAPPPPVPQDV